MVRTHSVSGIYPISFVQRLRIQPKRKLGIKIQMENDTLARFSVIFKKEDYFYEFLLISLYPKRDIKKGLLHVEKELSPSNGTQAETSL